MINAISAFLIYKYIVKEYEESYNREELERAYYIFVLLKESYSHTCYLNSLKETG